MLLKFSVRNYLSFKDEVVFDMTAEALKEKKNYVHIPYLHNPKINILKSASIYGYNAFGKSNLLKAYATFRRVILTSFTLGSNNNELSIEPFRLNTSMADEPTFFETIFILRESKYRYGFIAKGDIILEEWLYYADGAVRENPLFIRVNREFREVSKLWNKNASNRVEQSKIFTKSNNLFLSVMLSQEGIPRVDEISKWFKGNVILLSNFDAVNSEAARIYAKEEYRKTILNFLDNADLGFSSIFEKINNLIFSTGLHSDIINTLHDIEKDNFDLYTHHKVYDKDYKFQKMVEFHLQKNESSGSIKFFTIACFLAYAIKHGQLIFIDELDSSLHSQLLVFLITVFNSDKNNTSGSQLIFTSHNTIMLNNKLRRDQIWLIDKNEFGESSLYKAHSAKTPIRLNKSIEEDYRTAKIKKGVSKKVSDENNPPELFS